jgi:tRNA (cytidine/uridine-2'-O-)-methyltransferase
VLHVVLYQPEIPPNTGNVIRLCANTGTTLHLIHPLGFAMENRLLRRAGLDYREWARVQEHRSWQDFLAAARPARVLAFSTRGERLYTHPEYRPGDALLFGPETRGLPREMLARLPPEQVLRIPMVPGSRSLNLSNAVAVAVYEAWGQNGFAGATVPGGGGPEEGK